MNVNNINEIYQNLNHSGNNLNNYTEYLIDTFENDTSNKIQIIQNSLMNEIETIQRYVKSKESDENVLSQEEMFMINNGLI